MSAMTKKPVKASHGALRLFLPCSSSSPSDGEPARQAEAQEVERGQRGHRAGQDEGQEGQAGDHGVGQDVAEHDAGVHHAQRPGGADVVEVAAAQELGAHQPDQGHPAEQQHDAQQQPEAGLDDARQDDQQVERRHARPDLDEALEQEVDQPAEIALHRAGDDADDRAQDREHQAEQHRDAEAVDQRGPARRAPGRRCPASCRQRRRLQGLAAFALRARCRSCRGSAATRSSPWPRSASARPRRVVGLGREIAAEGGLGIVADSGE